MMIMKSTYDFEKESKIQSLKNSIKKQFWKFYNLEKSFSFNFITSRHRMYIFGDKSYYT